MSHRLVAIETRDGFSLGLFSGETVVGRFNLSGISRGPFQSGILSYWVDSRYTGCGLAASATESWLPADYLARIGRWTPPAAIIHVAGRLTTTSQAEPLSGEFRRQWLDQDQGGACPIDSVEFLDRQEARLEIESPGLSVRGILERWADGVYLQQLTPVGNEC